MENNDHQHISKDNLDIERTKMALERTYLSYIRTALTFLVAGATLLQFFDNATFRTIGAVLIPVAAILFTIGTVRIYKKKSRLQTMSKALLEED
ncbi:MAG: DUF202 domain-containing protein [Bacteroidia bacterium]